jgi:hypothetical protein
MLELFISRGRGRGGSRGVQFRGSVDPQLIFVDKIGLLEIFLSF